MKKIALILLVVVSSFANNPIEEWKDNFAAKMGIEFGQTDKKGRTFYFGQSIVNVTPLDPAYVKEMALAYEKAILNMQADFILQTFGKAVVRKLYETVENDSTNVDEFPPLPEAEKMASKGKIGIIIDKALDVIENSLDQKLIEQGVSPDRLKKMTIEQKKQLFKDNLTSNMIKQAFHSMRGLVPYQVKIATIDTGIGKATAVAVIAIQSPKTIQFAKDIAKKRPTMVRGKPKRFQEILPKKKEDYLKEIGLRYTYDEEGRPMLISYGLWSVTIKTKNPTRYLKKINIAKRKARMKAESFIGDFIKTNIEAVEKLDVSSIDEEIARKITTISSTSRSSQRINDEIKETLDKYFKTVKATSNFHLQGTSEIKNWDYKDQNGLIYVGSVVTWTYNQLQNAKNYINMQKAHKKPAKRQSTNIVIDRESKVINDIEDF